MVSSKFNMKDLFRNTLHILLPVERKQFFMLIMADIFISLADIVSMIFLLFVVNYFAGAPGENSLTMVNMLGTHKNILLPVALILFFSIKNLVAFAVQRLRFKFNYRIAARLSEKNILSYLNGAYGNYVGVDSAVHIRAISQQPIEFAQYILYSVQQVVAETILIIFTIASIFFFNAKLFLLLTFFLIPPVAFIAFLVRRKLGAVRLNIKVSNSKSLQHLREALSGYVESNLHDRNDFFTERYIQYQRLLDNYLASLQVTLAMPSRLMEVFAVFGLSLLVFVNEITGVAGVIDLVTLGAFMAAAYKIIPGAVKIMNARAQMRTYEYTVTDLVSPVEQRTFTGEQTGAIESVNFQQVSFSYADKMILNDLDSLMKQGDFIGISGKSGIGKTTIINLLLGFIDPSKGTIAINGKETTAHGRQAYWQRISYVKQQNFLLHDSILTNITLGLTAYDHARLDEVIQATGLDVFLSKHADGLNHIIAENGKNISGGERQRIALARALYKPSDLVILDEPFSELDKNAEESILKFLSGMAAGGKIIILITHNTGSLSYCNQVIRIKD